MRLLKLAKTGLRALRKIVQPNLHKPDICAAHSVYGSAYGGWPLLDNSVNAGSIVYSFGVGEDISFDIEIIRRFGCHVWAFDPTPKCRVWINSQIIPSQLQFFPLGIAAIDGESNFFAPNSLNHVSFSKAPTKASGTSNFIIAETKRLSSIMRFFGHDQIDILKMDVEGFEYEVINDIVSSKMRPRQILVEFHHRLYGISSGKTRHAVDKLRGAGYRLFYVSDTGREYGFCYASETLAERLEN